MAFDLDGTNHALAASASVANRDEGTFAGWFAPDFDVSTGVQNRYFFDTDATRHAFYYAGGSAFIAILRIEMYISGRYRSFDTAWTSGVFNHFAFVYNRISDIQELYINGSARTILGDGGSWATIDLGANFHIGQRFSSPESRFDGDVAEVASWAVALSAPEIASLAKGFSPLLVRPASLKAYWPLVRDGRPHFGPSAASLVGSPNVSAHSRMFY